MDISCDKSLVFLNFGWLAEKKSFTIHFLYFGMILKGKGEFNFHATNYIHNSERRHRHHRVKTNPISLFGDYII